MVMSSWNGQANKQVSTGLHGLIILPELGDPVQASLPEGLPTHSQPSPHCDSPCWPVGRQVSVCAQKPKRERVLWHDGSMGKVPFSFVYLKFFFDNYMLSVEKANI